VRRSASGGRRSRAKILVGELGRTLSPDLVRRVSSTREVNAMSDRPQRAEAALARRQAEAQRAGEEAARARDEAEKGRTAA
jgi:hypothetical protein